jgi:CBS domain-containing protein
MARRKNPLSRLMKKPATPPEAQDANTLKMPAVDRRQGSRPATTLYGLVKERKFHAVRVEQSLFEAARYMAERKVAAVPVVADRAVVGVLSEHLIATRLVTSGRDPKRVRVREVMSANVVVISSDETREAGLARLRETKSQHLLVVEGDPSTLCRILGLLTLSDLLAATVDELVVEPPRRGPAWPPLSRSRSGRSGLWPTRSTDARAGASEVGGGRPGAEAGAPPRARLRHE